MENNIRIGVVNFETVWGDKEANMEKIVSYIEESAEKGVQFLALPETAICGYMNEAGVDRSEKMHTRLAETIPGPSSEKLSGYAKKYNMFIVAGLAEKDENDPSIIYNSAAIMYPDGRIERYRKMHLPGDENDWAVRGKDPCIIDTPWGPVGLLICYDTYCFPELTRYYRSMGARLCVNITACPDVPWLAPSAEVLIPAYAFLNGMFIATSDLCHTEKGCKFIGGSSIIGPDPEMGPPRVYAGRMFNSEGSDEPGLIVGDIDLTIADNALPLPIFRDNPWYGEERDWRGDIYADLYKKSQDKYYNR